METVDIIYIVLAVVATGTIRFWLIKIYNRVKEIAQVGEHFLDKDR